MRHCGYRRQAIIGKRIVKELDDSADMRDGCSNEKSMLFVLNVERENIINSS